MKKIISLFFPVLALSSCATVFNGYYTDVRVHARRGDVVTYKNERGVVDTAHVMEDGTHILPVLRGKNPLELSVITDTGRQDITVKHNYSWLFYANIYPAYGVGMLVDCFSPKRFSYPSNIYPYSDVSKGYQTVRPMLPTKVSLTFMPPFISCYFLNPERFDFGGNVLGTGLGANYYYAKKSFFSGELVAGTWRITNADDYWPENRSSVKHRKGLSWVTVAARHHHLLGRLDLGYGLAGSWQNCREFDQYYYRRELQYDTMLRRANFVTLGGSFSVNLRLTNSWYVGVTYQPQILSLTGGGAVVGYSHTVNTGFFWRFPVRRRPS